MYMKKVCILMVTLLALAATCMGQSAPTNQPDSPHIKPPTATATPASTPAPGAASSEAKGGLDATLIAQEKEVWEAMKKKDLQGFAGYLAEDMIYVTKTGVHTKAETVKGIADGPMPELTLDDWKVTMIDNDAAIVTYRMNIKAVACGPAATSERNSTVWAKRNGKWLVVFHQDTMADSGQ
jgi:uncharacterized protein (TIGR02246 family)